mgnify:CR=1 FL=1
MDDPAPASTAVDPATQADVIHVLRTAQLHHVSLSMAADQKANIVLGSYLIFLTVTQSLLQTSTAPTLQHATHPIKERSPPPRGARPRRPRA